MFYLHIHEEVHYWRDHDGGHEVQRREARGHVQLVAGVHEQDRTEAERQVLVDVHPMQQLHHYEADASQTQHDSKLLEAFGNVQERRYDSQDAEERGQHHHGLGGALQVLGHDKVLAEEAVEHDWRYAEREVGVRQDPWHLGQRG
eukprot:scaffold1272_cov250-Pinguiococcus_pyrenoidosus.AAC.33